MVDDPHFSTAGLVEHAVVGMHNKFLELLILLGHGPERALPHELFRVLRNVKLQMRGLDLTRARLVLLGIRAAGFASRVILKASLHVEVVHQA